MINPSDISIKWTQKAQNDMTLITMIDRLYDLELIEGYVERLDAGEQPFPHYKALYENHKELLNDIVESFFPLQNFKPSQINVKNTNEYYLFEVINAIFYIVWYNTINNSRKGDRVYEDLKKELEEALNLIYGYSDCKEVDKLINFPAHQNEIIESLRNYFISINRRQQGEKVIGKIKDYFSIQKLTATNHKKLINANKNFIDQLKKEHSLNDEEVKQIPIIGQLQTKI